MRKSIFLLTLGALMLAACGSPAVTARPEAVGGEATAPAAPTETIVREIKADFVATDPSIVQLAAGKPQLVEFFAVW